MAGVGPSDRGCLGEREFATGVPDQRRHAVRFHCRQQGIEFSRCQAGYFFQRAGLEHGIETRVDPRVESFTLGLEKQRAECTLRQQWAQTIPIPVGERAAGCFNDFQRTGDAGAVASAAFDGDHEA